MKKNRIIKTAYFLALVFLFNIFAGSSMIYASNNSVNIEIPENKLVDYLKENSESETIKFWDLNSDKISIEELNILTDSELSSKYKISEEKINLDGNKIVLDDVEEGLYYFRNNYSTESTIYKSEFIVEVEANSGEIKIIDKITSQAVENGKVKLVKIDEEENRLENVGFELYDSNNNKVPLIGQYKYSESGNKDVVLYTDKNGEINVDSLPYGDYQFREVKPLPGYVIKEEKVDFSIKDNDIVELKVVNEKNKVGDYNFIKIANDKKQTVLEGATFKVTTLVNGKYESVKVNGKAPHVVSGSDGKFKVSGLPYGEYYLWEVKPPKGYRKLAQGVKFVIDGNSAEKVLFIKNEKETPISVPKTGDLMIPILLLSSIVLFTTGYKLSKNEEK